MSVYPLREAIQIWREATDAGRRDAATEERKKALATVFFLRVAIAIRRFYCVRYRIDRQTLRLLSSRFNILIKTQAFSRFRTFSQKLTNQNAADVTANQSAIAI